MTRDEKFDLRYKTLTRMAKDGLTAMEMTKALGLTYKTVRAFLKKYNIKYRKYCRTGEHKSKYDTAEFYKFCETHHMDEIVEKYGNGAENYIYMHAVDYIRHNHNDKMYGIMKELKKNELSQTAIGKMYGVSRQYVFQVKMRMEAMERKNGR